MDVANLKETECLFNWKLSHHHSPYRCQHLVKEFCKKLSDQNPYPHSYESRWALRLSLAHELFRLGRSVDALKEAEGAIDELDGVEYLASCEHIVYSNLAIMRNTVGQDIQSIVNKIIPFGLMNDQEKAGVYGNQAAILRIYGSKEVNRGIKVLKDAIRLDPSQREWKISLLSSLSRKRNHFKQRNRNPSLRISLESMAEELQLINELMSFYPIGTDVLYYDACAYAGLSEFENDEEVADGYRERVTSDCRRIVELGTSSPPVIAFCSKWFITLPSAEDQEMGFQML